MRLPTHWISALAIVAVSTLSLLPACRSTPATRSASAAEPSNEGSGATTDVPAVGEQVVKTEEEWRAVLTEQEFHILREAGTERAFSGELYDHHAEGIYHCAGCNAPLYSSADKFDSRTGWPSFTQPVEQGRVDTEEDMSLGMIRTEILCASCGGHLGHVFEDGPEPTGMRHCVNSAALDFRPADVDGDGEIRAGE